MQENILDLFLFDCAHKRFPPPTNNFMVLVPKFDDSSAFIFDLHFKELFKVLEMGFLIKLMIEGLKILLLAIVLKFLILRLNSVLAWVFTG